ncbi:MAG TPA: NosD domain-containing protein [Methanospirillum sp.]|nr:NosD domain-containing protein [Methanospirillum sp.]
MIQKTQEKGGNALHEIICLAAVFLIIMMIPAAAGAGSKMTIGDTILKTDKLRELSGSDGTGIMVGVISDGVKHIADAQKSGDIPDTITVLSDKRKGDEGTAMLEIIHDIAPNATLLFHDFGGNEDGFIIAIDALVAAGARIIVDDVGWQSDPFFQDGKVATHIKEIQNKNPDLIYISSAGNSGDLHYQGKFVNGGEGFHLFGSSSGIGVEIQPGGIVSTILEWDDPWGASKNDYDLALIDTASGGQISMSERNQTGTEDPHERMDYKNGGDKPVKAEIRVKAKEGAEQREIELFLYIRPDKATIAPGFLNPDDSIHGQPAVPEVLSVSAVAPSELAVIQKFASQGEITINYPVPEKRQKPDITGIDTVDVTGAGGFKTPFSGTSAAAPHIAGLLALERGLFPGLAAEPVKEALLETAQDLGSPGWDNQFGYGLADAMKMYEYLKSKQDNISDTQNGSVGPSQKPLVIPQVITPKKPVEQNGTATGAEENSITGPVTITKPGKYTLEKDIRDSSPVIITIATSGVEIAGNGHQIEGVGVRIGLEDPILQTGIQVLSSDKGRINGVTITGVSVTGCFNGIDLADVDGGEVNNCRLLYNANGILLNSTGATKVTNNEGMGNSFSGIIQTGNSIGSTISNNRMIAGLYGIALDQGQQATVSNNTVTDNALSGIILIHGSEANQISGNIVSGNKDGGISLYSSLKNNIFQNICRENNLWGILLHESSGNTITGNELTGNLRGMNLYYADGNTIAGNTIDRNRATGIFFNPSGNNTVRDNSISSNDDEGIMIGTEVRPNVQNLIYNNVMSNKDNIIIQEGAQVNYQWNIEKIEGTNSIGGTFLGGNMWGSPGGAGYSQMCTDKNTDGMCDGAYEVKPGIVDQFPLRSPGTGANVTSSSQSEDQVSTVTEAKSPSSADEWVEEGKSLKDRADYLGALGAYTKALGLSPNNYQALRDIALVYSLMKDYPQSIIAVDNAIAQYPDSTELWSTKGDFYLTDLKQYQDAADAYDKALMYDPADIHSLVNKAFALDKTGKSEEAYQLYMQAVEINPELTDAWYKAGNLLTKAGRYEEALPLYDKALSIDPASSYAWNNKGYALAQLKRFEEAVEAYTKALSLDSGYSVAWKNLGDTYTALKLTLEAEEAYSHTKTS